VKPKPATRKSCFVSGTTRPPSWTAFARAWTKSARASRGSSRKHKIRKIEETHPMIEKVTDVSDSTPPPMGGTTLGTPAGGPDAIPPAAADPGGRLADPGAGAPDAVAKEKGPSFADLGLRPEVLRAIDEMGFTDPMLVQAKTLPLIMEGRDLMVQSRTGSGKTAAFGIPFANGIANASDKFVQALVLLPTRELA